MLILAIKLLYYVLKIYIYIIYGENTIVKLCVGRWRKQQSRFCFLYWPTAVVKPLSDTADVILNIIRQTRASTVVNVKTVLDNILKCLSLPVSFFFLTECNFYLFSVKIVSRFTFHMAPIGLKVKDSTFTPFTRYRSIVVFIFFSAVYVSSSVYNILTPF